VDGWVNEILKSYGLAGAFIFVLLAAVSVQWRTIASKDKQLRELHAQRATERETLVRLLESANTAATVTANATEKRNEIMDDLGRALTSQANAVERYDDRVKGQAEMLKEKFSDFRHVVDAFGESNRVISGLISDIRNAIVQLESAINQMAVKIQVRGS
jgi:hypothetical protein